MSRNNRSKNRNNYHKPNFWGFLQNVLIAGLQKGQLLAVGMILIAIILAIKIPGREVLPFINSISNISFFNSALGWLFFIITIFAGYKINKSQCIAHTTEIQRISKEKKIFTTTTV